MPTKTTPLPIGNDVASVVRLQATYHAILVQDDCLVIRVTGHVVGTAGQAPEPVPTAPALAPPGEGEEHGREARCAPCSSSTIARRNDQSGSGIDPR